MLPVRGHVQQEGQSEAAHAHPRTLQEIQMPFQVREQNGDQRDGRLVLSPFKRDEGPTMFEFLQETVNRGLKFQGKMLDPLNASIPPVLSVSFSLDIYFLFASISNRTHVGCTKEFNRPDKLKAHILSHSGEQKNTFFKKSWPITSTFDIAFTKQSY